jgi:hypothetical protein
MNMIGLYREDECFMVGAPCGFETVFNPQQKRVSRIDVLPGVTMTPGSDRSV